MIVHALSYYTKKLLELQEDCYFKIYQDGAFAAVRYLVSYRKAEGI